MTFDQAQDALRDPGTSGQILAEIAYLFPQLRDQVKVHPEAYFDLVVWINQTGLHTVLQPSVGVSADGVMGVVPAKKPKLGPKWVVILGIVLAVLGGSAGAYAVFGDNEPKTIEVVAPRSLPSVPPEKPVVEEALEEPVAVEGVKPLGLTPLNEVFPDPIFAECIAEGLGAGKVEITDRVDQSNLDFLDTPFARERLFESPNVTQKGTTENQIYVAAKNGNFLTCDNPDLTSIEGAQYLSGLTYLQLTSNSDLDLTPLSGLDGLVSLSLLTPNLSDISPIRGLTNLKDLSLSDNQVTDISALEEMTELMALGLKDMPIVDISPLANLIKMQTLSLAGTQISDVSALSGMTQVHFLALYDTNISDISPLRSMETLMDVGLGDTDIADISALSGKQYLWELRLDNTQVQDVEPLKSNKNLSSLDLSGTNVNDISALQGLPNLQFLMLQDTNVDDLSQLDALVANGLTVHQ